MSMTRDMEELEARRQRGIRLLALGMRPAEVARQLGVSRQSVLRWSKRYAEGGETALQRPLHFGRRRRLDDVQRAELVEALNSSALSAGFSTELWTLRRIGILIEARFGMQFSQSSVWRILRQLDCDRQGATGLARGGDERATDVTLEVSRPPPAATANSKVEDS